MIYRCTRPTYNHWSFYGGRGVRVCERWLNSFPAFLLDMGPRPTGRTLDRIDPNGNYEPSNCRWATSKEQGANKRPRRGGVTFDEPRAGAPRMRWHGRTLSIAGWARETGISFQILWNRFRNGWSVDRALTQPPRKQPATYAGKPTKSR
jgi:hypothetical protein